MRNLTQNRHSSLSTGPSQTNYSILWQLLLLLLILPRTLFTMESVHFMLQENKHSKSEDS